MGVHARDGIKWQDGSAVTCDDVKYGVSRTFDVSVTGGGPTYASQYLDIPVGKDGTSVYKGPFVTKNNDTAAYDKAVTCSGQTITFHLAKPVGDFNYTVTLGFGAVPKAADTGTKYTDAPMSDGPYKIQTYSKGNQMVLVRNENWEQTSDPYRPAYPDKIVVKFGLSQSVIDQRMIKNAGEDQQAFNREPLLATDLPTVFNDDQYKIRRTNELSPFSDYKPINTLTVPNVKQRQAIMVAMDRASIQQIAGGTFAGVLGDGAIKSNLLRTTRPRACGTRCSARRSRTPVTRPMRSS